MFLITVQSHRNSSCAYESHSSECVLRCTSGISKEEAVTETVCYLSVFVQVVVLWSENISLFISFNKLYENTILFIFCLVQN